MFSYRSNTYLKLEKSNNINKDVLYSIMGPDLVGLTVAVRNIVG